MGLHQVHQPFIAGFIKAVPQIRQKRSVSAQALHEILVERGVHHFVQFALYHGDRMAFAPEVGHDSIKRLFDQGSLFEKIGCFRKPIQRPEQVNGRVDQVQGLHIRKMPQQVQSQEPTRGVPGDLQRPRLPAIVFQPGEVGGKHILKHVIMEIIPMSPAQAVGDVGLVHGAQSGYVEMRDCIHSAAKSLNQGRKVALFPVTEGVEVRSSAGPNLCHLGSFAGDKAIFCTLSPTSFVIF
jgi:hypothetical protein